MSILLRRRLLGLGDLAVDQSVMDSNTDTEHELVFDEVPKVGTFMSAFFLFNAASVTVTMPPGWTEQQTVGGGGSSSPICRLYWKVAGVAESNSYNFQTALSINVKWIGVNLINANSVTPFESWGANSSGAANVTTLNANTIPANAGSIVLAMYASGGPTTSSTNGYASLEQDGVFGVHFKKYTTATTENTVFSCAGAARFRTISFEIIQ